MNIDRHKVFISFCHDDDNCYKKKLLNQKDFDKNAGKHISIFDNYSVGEGDISDTLPDEQIRKIIRKKYIKNATVLILLCGENSKHRKFIDWELQAAMFDSKNNPQLGIVVINLPTISQNIYSCSNDEKSLLSPNNDNWYSLTTRSQFEEAFPYLPDRIIDNLVKGVPITVVNWDTIIKHNTDLMKLIDNAFNRRKDLTYDNHRPLKRHNSKAK